MATLRIVPVMQQKQRQSHVCPPLQAFPSLGHAYTSSALGSVTCHPAALDEHAPALQGPLHLTASGGARHDSLLDFLDADDDVVACQMLG